MLRRLNLTLGQTVLVQGREYRFTGEISRDGAAVSEPRDIGLSDARTGAPICLTLLEFHRLYRAGEIRLLRSYEQVRHQSLSVSEPEAAKALWRRCWCEAHDKASVRKSDSALLGFIDRIYPEVAACGLKPSPGSLRRWLRERGAPGDRRSRFMGDRRGEGRQSPRIDPTAMRILEERAEAFYDGVRLNPHAVYFAVRAAIAALNEGSIAGAPQVLAPSESTVRRYLRRHMDYGKAVRRYGWKEGGRRFKPVQGSMSAKHILDIAIIDQTLIDCTVIDDEHLINVGRPWLAVMIDVRSRYPLGFCLSFEKPSVETVLACIRHGVRPKDEVAELEPAVQGEWIGFGVPDTIVVDNAWENTGSSFRDACADANISIVFAPVATPEYKGICERYFHTLNTMLFHRLPGGLPFTPQVRKHLEIDNEREAALMLSDVKRAIYQCNVEVYGRQFHKALQASPEQVWRREAPLHGRPYVEDLAALDLALAKLVPGDRTLSRAGITQNDLTYAAPEPLAELLADLVPLQAPRTVRPGTAKVKLKYHPEDLALVHVWNPARRRYVTLPCTQPGYAKGLSEYHHKLIRSFAMSEHLSFQSEEERCRARTRLQDLVLPSIPLSKVRARQNAQRLKGQAHLQPVTRLLTPSSSDIPIGVIVNRSDRGEAHRSPAPNRRRKSKPAVRPWSLEAPSVDGGTVARAPFGEWFGAGDTSDASPDAAALAGFDEFFPAPDVPEEEGFAGFLAGHFRSATSVEPSRSRMLVLLMVVAFLVWCLATAVGR